MIVLIAGIILIYFKQIIQNGKTTSYIVQSTDILMHKSICYTLHDKTLDKVTSLLVVIHYYSVCVGGGVPS